MFESKVTTPHVIRSAQENSLSIRYEYVRLIEQVLTGLAAIEQFLAMNEQGLNQKLLDHIWKTAIGVEPPLNTESVMNKISKLLDTRS